MTAKQYLDKYYKYFIGPSEHKDALLELLTDMSNEVLFICEKRNISLDSGILSVLNEMNHKWNDLCSLFEKEYGFSPFIIDGFSEFWRDELESLNDLLQDQNKWSNNNG